MRRYGLWFGIWAALLLLAGCASQLPQPPERIYFPLLLSNPNKLGLAGCPASCDLFGCAWCYSWNAQPTGPAGVETVPMIWDERMVYAPVSDSEWVMGFNEPDLPGQANLSPEEAVEPWALVEARFAGRKLVAPVPSHLHPEWLPQFRETFQKRYGRYPRFDALAMHCYFSWASSCVALLERFEGWARAWGVSEIWVTEFNFRSETQGRAFVAELERRESVRRYAPYVSYKPCLPDDPFWDCAANGNPSMLQSDRMTPTDMGRWYAKPEQSETRNLDAAPRDLLAAPDAPVINYARTRTVQHVNGPSIIGGAEPGEAWADLHLFWQHPDPITVDHYEVWRTSEEPYWTPSACISCTLALTTTAQRAIFEGSPPPFNPVGGTTGYDLRSAFDFYQVLAVNAGGDSEPSAALGTVIYSLEGGESDPEHPPVENWPTPRPTHGPSPTPTPTLTPTPVGTITPGPSPTPAGG